MKPHHRQIAILASTLAQHVVDEVGTLNDHRTADLKRALAKAIGEHVLRCTTEQVAVDDMAAAIEAGAR